MVRLLIILYILLQNCLSFAQEDTSKLTINQQAPPLKAEKWLKGQPIANFEKGQVYIIELGFISCAPCRVAIPHLTELAKKYKGKANVISIFVYENNKEVPGKLYINKVEKFIKGYGDKIGYNVAVDDEAQTIARTWYEPASRAQSLGFPAIFVVDHTGNIVWIGSATQIDDVVKKTLEMKLNPIYEKEMQDKYFDINRRIARARNNKEYKTALSLYDSLISVSPTNIFLYREKFSIFLESDINKAICYGRDLLRNQYHNYESVLNKMAWDISSFDYLKVYRENRELMNLLIDFCNRVLELTKSHDVSSNTLRVQARAYFMNKQYEKAIETQEHSISEFDKAIHPDPDKEKRTRDVLVQTLNKYRLRDKAYDFKQ